MIFEVYFEDVNSQTITKPIVLSRSIAKDEMIGLPNQEPLPPHRWAKDISRLQESSDPIRFALNHFGLTMHEKHSLESRLKGIAHAEKVGSDITAARDLGLAVGTIAHWRKGKEQMIAAINLLKKHGIKDVNHIHLGSDAQGRLVVEIDEHTNAIDLNAISNTANNHIQIGSIPPQPSAENEAESQEEKEPIGILDLLEADDPVRLAMEHFRIPVTKRMTFNLETRLKGIAYAEHFGSHLIAARDLDLPRSSLRTWVKQKEQYIAAIKLLQERNIEEVNHIHLRTDNKGRLVVNIDGDSNRPRVNKPIIPSRQSTRLESKRHTMSRPPWAIKSRRKIIKVAPWRTKARQNIVPAAPWKVQYKPKIISAAAGQANSIQSPIKSPPKISGTPKKVIDISKLAEAKDPVALALSYFGNSVYLKKHSLETRLKAIALAEKLKNNTAAARELGLDEASIRSWLKKKTQFIEAIKLLKENDIEAVKHINITTDSEGRLLVDFDGDYEQTGLNPNRNASAGQSWRKYEVELNANIPSDYEAAKSLEALKSTARVWMDQKDSRAKRQDLTLKSTVGENSRTEGPQPSTKVDETQEIQKDSSEEIQTDIQIQIQIDPKETPKLQAALQSKKVIMVQTEAGLVPLHEYVIAKRAEELKQNSLREDKHDSN